MNRTWRLRALIERAARLSEAEAWDDGLNPTQAAALAYLASANRFSRAPSQVADYLGATRGTVSQTLKALARKGLVAASPEAGDGRRMRYDPTPAGRLVLARPGQVAGALERMPDTGRAALEAGLEAALTALLAARAGRSFGICRTCRHYRGRGEAGYCTLLDVALEPEETGLLCHEHAAA